MLHHLGVASAFNFNFLFYLEHDNQSRDEFELPPPMVKHDMTLEELKQYDGRAQDKRICIAIKGKVYDVTKGYRFYGPNGPYAPLAGHDASRALATFNVNAVKDEFDDLSDLNQTEMSSVNEWEEQFSERYELVGNLVRNKDDIDNDNDINDE